MCCYCVLLFFCVFARLILFDCIDRWLVCLLIYVGLSFFVGSMFVCLLACFIVCLIGCSFLLCVACLVVRLCVCVFACLLA